MTATVWKQIKKYLWCTNSIGYREQIIPDAVQNTNFPNEMWTD